MLNGKYYNDSKNKMIYVFDNGRTVTPKYQANLTNTDILVCKEVIEKAYGLQPAKRAKAITVAGVAQWDKVVRAGYNISWQEMAAWHVYSSANAGVIPEWAKGIQSMNTLIVHEYKPGLVAYMGKETDFDMYFKDATYVLVPIPSVPPVEKPVNKLETWMVIAGLAVLLGILITLIVIAIK